MKKVLMTDELFEALGASRVEWGEPDADGFYTPTVYRDDDELQSLREAVRILQENWPKTIPAPMDRQ